MLCVLAALVLRQFLTQQIDERIMIAVFFKV